VCKDGTALNNIYFGGVQRFSEDLDFDAFFEGSLTRRQKLEFLQQNLTIALTKHYEVQTPRMMREVVRFTCSFENEMGKKAFDVEVVFLEDLAAWHGDVEGCVGWSKARSQGPQGTGSAHRMVSSSSLCPSLSHGTQRLLKLGRRDDVALCQGDRCLALVLSSSHVDEIRIS
jgi:hypothetical protein